MGGGGGLCGLGELSPCLLLGLPPFALVGGPVRERHGFGGAFGDREPFLQFKQLGKRRVGRAPRGDEVVGEFDCYEP